MDDFSPQQFYKNQGQISHAGRFEDKFDPLPDDLFSIIKALQGLVLHPSWAAAYGLDLARPRQNETGIRTVQDKLEKLFTLCDLPLTEPRPPAKRLVGNCRDFALLLTAILRHKGMAARARCGFARYFEKHKFIDHWVTEIWQADGQKWLRVDGQLDEMQMERLKIKFDPLNLPAADFWLAGKAWQHIRNHEIDPMRFGIFQWWGRDFVKASVIRDFLALNKVELMPWDNFLLMDKKFSQYDATEKALIDRLAIHSSGDDRDFVMLRAGFLTHATKFLPRYFF